VELSPAEQKLLNTLKRMTADERQEWAQRIFALIDLVEMEQRHKKRHPTEEAIIELYAFKSFQEQDTSGVFNQARMNDVIAERRPPETVQNTREYFSTLDAEGKRSFLFNLKSEYMHLDYLKISTFDEDERDEAIEEIVLALKERNKGSEKEWPEAEYYEQARLAFDWAQDIKQTERPEAFQFYLSRFTATIQRRREVRLVSTNQEPKKRRGKRKTKHLQLINGGWTGEWPAKKWLAMDLLT